MGHKARTRPRPKTAAEVVETWLAETGGRTAHAYRREHNGVHVLMFVAGDEVTAETGLGIAVQSVIASEIAGG